LLLAVKYGSSPTEPLVRTGAIRTASHIGAGNPQHGHVTTAVADALSSLLSTSEATSGERTMITGDRQRLRAAADYSVGPSKTSRRLSANTPTARIGLAWLLAVTRRR
jgi:hypothetical protein